MQDHHVAIVMDANFEDAAHGRQTQAIIRAMVPLLRKGDPVAALLLAVERKLAMMREKPRR